MISMIEPEPAESIRRLVDLRVGLAFLSHLQSAGSMAILAKSRTSFTLPSLTALSEELGVSRPSVWRAMRTLVGKNLVRVSGEGKSTTYSLRNPQRFLGWLREIFLRRTRDRVYLPFLLPRKFHDLDFETRVSELANLASASLPGEAFAFVLHSAARLSPSSPAVYSGKEIEMMIRSDARDETFAALRLSPLFPQDMPRRTLAGRLFPADVTLVQHDLVDWLLKEKTSISNGFKIIDDTVNFLELSIYPRRGEEAADRIFQEWTKS